jgi:aconitate hydratase
MPTNSFNSKSSLVVGNQQYTVYLLSALQKAGIGRIDRLPFSIRILLEALLRTEDGRMVTAEDVTALANWNAKTPGERELPFMPGRVVMQDFTGVPGVVDLAAMRSAMHRMGGDPDKINPLVPVDLVIDHSVQVDFYGSDAALMLNSEKDFERNRERYLTMAWASKAFDNFRVVPPSTGIVHQVNLEFLADVVSARTQNGELTAFPDSLVGTDSHTTMINGLGVLGWGVGGIEAEGVMLGQPVYMLTPEVVGFRLSGKLPEGTTATDMTLTVVQMLRKFGVVGKFVEFFGPALASMSLPDRATIANMAPEYGATMGFFPVDQEALDFLRRTGRNEEVVQRVEAYCKANLLFRDENTPEPEFTAVLELDLSTVQPSLAGPKRPQDRVVLSDVQASFQKALQAPIAERGFNLPSTAVNQTSVFNIPANGKPAQSVGVGHGAVVIASITSCTNTSNPSVMVAAGLLARKAVQLGLQPKPFVKASLAPGSRVVTEYLNEAGLSEYLDQVGFYTVGYGCTTCIGNSGPLDEYVTSTVEKDNLVVSAVLSGNRNFEGRIHSHVKANYLASPPLVVAFALAGTMNIDLETQPIGEGTNGPVYLRDIWPSQQEVADTIARAVKREHFVSRYGNVFDGNPEWNKIAGSGGKILEWDANSTYIQEPPFFQDVSPTPPGVQPIHGARVLVMVGDSITTDHISPAGNISKTSPAAKYLMSLGVKPEDFNQYGTRRGNDQVMTRGTFANIRLKNVLMGGEEGGNTLHLPDGAKMSIYDAAMQYKAEGTPLVVLAGKEYGTGSSRDWAAKGTFLLGVKAVIAESFERIHRSNLVMMGVLPLVFANGASWGSLGLTGHELIDVEIPADLQPRQAVTVTATRADGSQIRFQAIARIDTPVEGDYYAHGGILQLVLRKLSQN